MRRCFVLSNHVLTEDQKKELKNKYFVEIIIEAPKDIASIWSQIPAYSDFNYSLLKKIIDWISNADPEDYAVVQGELTYSFYIVDYLLKNKITVLAAITERVSTEIIHAEYIEKKSIFRHCGFRPYHYFVGT